MENKTVKYFDGSKEVNSIEECTHMVVTEVIKPPLRHIHPLVKVSTEFNGKEDYFETRGLNNIVRKYDSFKSEKIKIDITFDNIDQFETMLNEINLFKDFLDIHKYCFWTPKK